MTVFLCRACGTSFPDAEAPPAALPDLRRRAAVRAERRPGLDDRARRWPPGTATPGSSSSPGSLSLQTVPAFAINQRAFLVATPAGNLLWDCVALLDAATEAIVRGARRAGGDRDLAPALLHHDAGLGRGLRRAGATCTPPTGAGSCARTRRSGSGTATRLPVLPGVTAGAARRPLRRRHGRALGGGADGDGALLAGDILQVTPGAHGVSFLWSYPNMLPLPAADGAAARSRGSRPGATAGSTAPSPARTSSTTARRSSPAPARATARSLEGADPA